jgi:hypothetical protein
MLAVHARRQTTSASQFQLNLLLPPCRLVTCTPADPIIVHIQDYRATLGGWIRLAFKNVAGDAALTAVELAVAGSDFRAPVSACRTRVPTC